MTVKISQVRSAFGFGSAVTAAHIEGSRPDDERYRDVVKKCFTKVVMENDLKWPNWENADSHKQTLAAIAWLHEQGITVRGHNLVWPSWYFAPHSLAKFQMDPVVLESYIEDHIRDEVSATKGMVTEWDVVNEPFTHHEILDRLQEGTMAKWFTLAHEVDPKPELFLNDFAGLVDRGTDTPHKQGFQTTLRDLKAEGAPIGGLGIQAHFGDTLTDPALLVKELDRWAVLGLNIQITEFDIDIADEAVQAQYTRDFMTAVFSHPKVSAILMWGFWEGSHWKPRAALYRKDWSVKPNGEAWNELVMKEWRTDVTDKTDAAGTFSTRGFLGDYEVTVTSDGVTARKTLSIGTHGGAVTIPLPAK